MAGKRALDAVVEKRILDVFKLLLRGASRDEILRHLAENDGTAERTAEWYIGKATQRFKALAKVDAEKERGRQLSRLEDLYSRLFRIQDYRTALAVLKERNELAGLYPEKVQKHEHTGRDGAPMSSSSADSNRTSTSFADDCETWTAAQRTKAATLLSQLDPKATDLMRAAGIQPDPWQRDVLLSAAPRSLLLCSRQAGKSTTVAALAAFEAVFKPGSLTLLLSPSLRQSSELFRKVLDFYRAVPGAPRPTADSALRMELGNGSRVVSLPGSEETVRGYSAVDLLVVDEAARVPDSLYHGVRPMLAVSGGRLVALSTPWAKAGWYYSAWTSSEPWERHRITASDCPRIAPSFLDEERRALPPAVFAREYEATFTDSEDAYFRDVDIERALSAYVEPLFPEAAPALPAPLFLPTKEK